MDTWELTIRSASIFQGNTECSSVNENERNEVSLLLSTIRRTFFSAVCVSRKKDVLSGYYPRWKACLNSWAFKGGTVKRTILNNHGTHCVTETPRNYPRARSKGFACDRMKRTRRQTKNQRQSPISCYRFSFWSFDITRLLLLLFVCLIYVGHTIGDSISKNHLPRVGSSLFFRLFGTRSRWHFLAHLMPPEARLDLRRRLVKIWIREIDTL